MTEPEPETPREEGLFGPGGAKFVAVLLALAAIGVAAFVFVSLDGDEEPAPLGSLRAPPPAVLDRDGSDRSGPPERGPGAIEIPPLPELPEPPAGLPPEARRAIELGRKRLDCIRRAGGDIDAITGCVERFAP